jgi:hypothetical protein
MEKVVILADASAMSLRHATTMHRQQSFAFNWLNLFSVFMTSLALMYTITAQPEQIGNYLRRSNALEDLRLAVKLLETFAQKFHIAEKYRDIVLGVIVKLEAQLDHVCQETQMSPVRLQSRSKLQPEPSISATRSPSHSNPNLESQHTQREAGSSNYSFLPNASRQQHIFGLTDSSQMLNFLATKENLPLATQVFQTSGLFDDLPAHDLNIGFDEGGVNGSTSMNTDSMEVGEDFWII